MFSLRLDLAALLLGLSAAVVGGAAMTGYLASLPGLLRPSPDTAPIAFSAGIVLVLGGLAVAATSLPPMRWIRGVPGVIGALVCALGLETLLAHVFGLDLALDLAAFSAPAGAVAAREHMVPAASACFAVLGAVLAALRFLRGRRSATVLTVAATACGAFAATSLAGYLLDVEVLVSWPSASPLPPYTALGIALLGIGVCSAVIHEAKLSPNIAQESRIELTAVWILSVFAVVAGVATFALAQYEYQDSVRADLVRTLRDRRSYLDYAIREHQQQVLLGAHSAFAASLGKGGHVPAAARDQLQASADVLTKSGFSGWRFHVGDVDVTSGAFAASPQFAFSLVGPYTTELLLNEGTYLLRTRIPIRADNREIGFAVAEDPLPELTRLKLEADSWGNTGGMSLCTALGQDLACFPSRSDPAGGRVAVQAGGRPLPMRLALDQEVGIREALDSRQRRVLAAYGPVGFTGLAMVMRIEISELNAPLARRFGAAVATLVTLVIAGVWLLRRRLRPLTKALVDAREQATRVAVQFKSAAESSLDAYFLMDAVRDRRGRVTDFRIRYMNPSGEVLVSRPQELVIGRTLRELLPDEQSRYFIERYARIVSTGESLSEQFRMSPTDPAALWIGHQAVKLGDGVSVTARDITELKNVERQLRSKAENDVLTGLPNRAIFFDRLGRGLAEARQSASGVAVLFLDVDRFKQINDAHGHAAGDAVLVEFAARVRKLVRSTDTVARLGGDEFAILLPKLESVAQAERVAADIVRAIGTPFTVGALVIDVGTSIGVGFSAAGHDTPEALVGRADRKLYQAKTGGRGRFASGSEKRAA
jgi:diguanylate cyclase (GGDEF)-like protein